MKSGIVGQGVSDIKKSQFPYGLLLPVKILFCDQVCLIGLSEYESELTDTKTFRRES